VAVLQGSTARNIYRVDRDKLKSTLPLLFVSRIRLGGRSVTVDEWRHSTGTWAVDLENTLRAATGQECKPAGMVPKLFHGGELPQNPNSAGELISWPLSDGAVHFFYWFIQGSIMFPDTRDALRRSWGFCERHAWACLSVEMAFRNRFLLGPAILYEELLELAVRHLAVRGLFPRRRLSRALFAKRPCMACELDIENAGRGAFSQSLLDRGREIEPLRSFALETNRHWRKATCGVCSGDGSSLRCRPHLVQDLAAKVAVDQTAHCRNVQFALTNLTSFYRSLLWGYTGAVTAEQQASIFAAVGWMSGWRPLLALTATPRLADEKPNVDGRYR
jgi:hypothetical protein